MRKDAIETALGNTKEAFGGQRNSPVHCKDLLHDGPRSKSDWAHLSRSQAYELLAALAEVVREAGARSWVGYVDTRDVPDVMVFEREGRMFKQTITTKHLPQLAYWAAVGPVFDLIPHVNIRAWMDPNRLRISWFGQKRQLPLGLNTP